jgi:hypothetical protein
MAGLAHGKAVATTAGWLTEPVWSETGCVALAPAGDPTALARVAAGLVDDPHARARLGAVADAVYRRLFALERTVEALLRDPEPSPATPAARASYPPLGRPPSSIGGEAAPPPEQEPHRA